MKHLLEIAYHHIVKKYHFLYLFWLIPAYFLFLTLQQTAVYNGLKSTYANGTGYVAEILDFNIKQIAAQRSGHVTILFNTSQGQSKTLSIGVSGETVARLSQYEFIPIRYSEDSYIEVVFTPTYEVQRGFILSNMAMACVAFIITFFIGLWAHRRANKQRKEGRKELVFERVD